MAVVSKSHFFIRRHPAGIAIRRASLYNGFTWRFTAAAEKIGKEVEAFVTPRENFISFIKREPYEWIPSSLDVLDFYPSMLCENV